MYFLILYEIITNPIYNWIGIKKGSSREALTIPIQQFARLMIYINDELTDVQKDKIKEYLPIDNFKDLYNPVFAEPRYVYCLFTTLPILIPMTIFEKNDSRTKEN